jgi:integrase
MSRRLGRLPKYVVAILNRERARQVERYYFRRRRGKAIRLPGPPYSTAFLEAYAMALAGALPETAAPIGEARIAAGSVAALVAAFYKTASWQNLALDSRRTIQPVIERFRRQHGSKRVALLRQDHIALMLDEIAKPSAKLKWLKAIRLLMRAAIPAMIKDDPTAGIKVALPRSKGWHSWDDQQIEQYRAHWRIGTEARLVFEFALESYSRRSEIARLGPQHVRNGRIRIERIHGSRAVNIPLTPELAAAIAAMPKTNLTFVADRRGKPLSPDALARQFAKWAKAAGLPDRCRLHGLKKGGMRRAAEAGISAHQLASLSGHKTLAMVQRYCDSVDREKLADAATEQILRSRSVPAVTQTGATDDSNANPKPLIRRKKKSRTE